MEINKDMDSEMNMADVLKKGFNSVVMGLKAIHENEDKKSIHDEIREVSNQILSLVGIVASFHDDFQIISDKQDALLKEVSKSNHLSEKLIEEITAMSEKVSGIKNSSFLSEQALLAIKRNVEGKNGDD